MMWTILIDGEYHSETNNPESVIEDLEFEFDIFSESWCGETKQVYLLTETEPEFVTVPLLSLCK